MATDIGFARGGNYYGFLVGFDPRFQQFAPGKCLLLKRIDEWATKDGITTLDFLSGSEAYKKSFTQGEGYEVCSLQLMPSNLRNKVRHAGLLADVKTRRLAKRTLSKVGLRS